jgi:acyl-CoA reductase-like NAD-dependent aldehyde dehydrogenase
MTTTTSVPVGNVGIPTPDGRSGATDHESLEAAVRQLAARKAAWTRTGIDERIAILDRLLADGTAMAEEWVRAECRAKHRSPHEPAAADVWAGGPLLWLRTARLLRDTLRQVRRNGAPRHGTIVQRPDGRTTVRVIPATVHDRALMMRWRGEVWTPPGVSAEELRKGAAAAYRPGRTRYPGVCLVIGAGNISGLQAMDVLHQLFAEDRVAVLVPSPLQAQVTPFLEAAFAALIEPGYLRVVQGGPEEVGWLAHHELVDALHLTGSDKTYEAIVFGSGEEGARRKAAGTPLLDKPFTAELGSVSPVIVVPGPWSSGDLAYQGESLVSMTVTNQGFVCLASRLLITHRSWRVRPALLEAVRAGLRLASQAPAYYPGAGQRHAAYADAYPQVERIGRTTDELLPWLFAPGLNSAIDEYAFRVDPFCGAVAETALQGAEDIGAYLDQAVELCNDRLWGNLVATIVVHPRSLRDPRVAAAVDRAVASLRYGTVTVNLPAGAAIVSAAIPWGGYPGNTPTDIQSGIGFTQNTTLIETVEKGVLTGPFRVRPTPPILPSHPRPHTMCQRWAMLEGAPSARALARVLAEARP